MECNTINSTLELFTLLMLACLTAALLHERNGFRRDAMFLAVIAGHALNTAGDLLAWRFAGKAGALAAAMAKAGNILTYLCIPIVSAGFLMLLFAYAAGRRRVNTAAGRWLAGAIAAVSAASMLILAGNPWTGLLYRIDEENRFYWGTASAFLPDGAVLVQLVLFYGLLAVELRGEKCSRLWRTLLCCALPTAAILAEIAGAGIMLLYPTLATALLLLYFARQQDMEEQMLRQRAELADSRARLLLAQIQPHFIFNALLAIQQLCRDDPRKAETAVGDFSRYLRGNLDAMTDRGTVPFPREMEHIRCYLALEQADPASRVRAEYRLEATAFRLPPLTVQPLVENAVRHGVKPKPEGGTVTIASGETAEGWTVTVADDGVGFGSGAAEHRSVGMENVRTRLEACGGTLKIETGEGGTVATVFIPKTPETRMTEETRCAP